MKRIMKRSSNYAKLGLIVLVVAVAGLSLSHITFAATGSLTFSPGSGSHNVGDTFTVTVIENSGTDSAVSVKAIVDYPASLLRFDGDTVVAPFTFNPASTDTASGGVISIQRASLSGTGYTGAQTVSTMTFTVLAAGTATLSFENSSVIADYNTGNNVLVSKPSATYTLSVPPPASPVISAFTATPSSVSSGGTSVLAWASSNVVSGGCSIPSTSVTAGDPSGSLTTPALTSSTTYTLTCKNSANVPTSKAVTVSVTTPPPGGSGSGSGSSGSTKSTSVKVGDVTVPNNGNVAVSTPVGVQPATIQTEGVSKVEYYLNGKLVDTETKPPFTYKVDTTKLDNGTYKLTSKTFFSNGSTKQTTQNLQVKNTAKKSNTAGIGLSLFILAAIIGGIILIQRHRGRLQPSYGAMGESKVVTSDTAPQVVAPITPLPQPTATNLNAPQPGTVIGQTTKPDDKL